MSKEKKRITIYDLAEELGVSASTVSRALNDHYSIGAKTKKAITQLARKRNYRPNPLASSLRTNRSNTIGILVSWINRPFISSLISGVEKAARKANYHVIISQSYDKTDLEKENLKALFDSRVSALIVSLAMETVDYEHFNLFMDNDIPVVFVDRIPEMNEVAKVNINNFNAAFEATEHLIDQGCRRIAHIGGVSHQVAFKDRKFGYLAALKKNNLDVDESLIFEASIMDLEEGSRIAQEMLASDNLPDGVFCANDTAAVSTIKYAKKRGIKIPEQLAVIGFNNDPICEIVDPPLSSIYHPAVAMGEMAIGELLTMLDGESSVNKTLDTHLIVRASSDRSSSADH